MAMKSNRERGQILIMTTLLGLPIFGVLGLVTDLGYMHYVKMTAQSAAEAAAQSAMIDFHQNTGASAYSCGGNVVCASNETACAAGITSPANSIQDGCMYAQAHGFTSAGAVTYQTGVSSTPPTAPGMGQAAYWVTFRTYKTVPQLFSAVLGNTSGLVVGRSTAAIVGTNDCIYALDPTMQASISVGGTATLTSACGIYDNSSANCALQTTGSGGNNGTGLTAPEYDVVGTACTQNGALLPSPNTGVAHTADPLSSWAAPASPPYTGCHNYPNGGGNGSTITLDPGCYTGGIQVKNNRVVFNPGVYVLIGGGLTTQDTNSIISGTGVEFYNTFDANHSYQPININANSSATLSAPTNTANGGEPGMLFFADRNAPSGNSCGNNGSSSCADNYGGGANAMYQGIIYNRNNCITMDGNSSQSQYSILVADCISLQGTSSINNNYSSLPNGQSPLQKVAVVE